MKAITDALNGSNAKMVTVTVQKGKGELTFKMEASQMKGHHAYYSSYYIPAADRRRFQQVFGRNADFKAEDVIRITYGRNTIYKLCPHFCAAKVPSHQIWRCFSASRYSGCHRLEKCC